MITKKVVISIPKEHIDPWVDKLIEFKGIGNIGKVYLPGDWNRWGESPKRGGCIEPNEEMEMNLIGDCYVIEVELTRGIHGFKPVVVKAEEYEDGMAPCFWIKCPIEGVDNYKREMADTHANWLVKVKIT